MSSAVERALAEAAALEKSEGARAISPNSDDLRVSSVEFHRLVTLVRQFPVLQEECVRQRVQLAVQAAKHAAADEQSTLRRRKAGGSSSSSGASSSGSKVDAPAASLDRQRTALSLLNTLGGGAQDYVVNSSASSSRSSITAVGDDSDTLLPPSSNSNSGASGDGSGSGSGSLGSKVPARKAGGIAGIGGWGGSEDVKQNLLKKQNLVLFFKGLAAWALCYIFGYSFDMVSVPRSMPSMGPLSPHLVSSLNKGLLGTQWLSEVNSSAAFALLMHSMGFSVFLLYFTGQIRWLALNGVVGLAMMWVFNLTGMEARWIVFSTHSVGYVLLAIVIVVMVLVFGGVVLVWTSLMEFLTDILARYPEVKDELSENALLEQVLSRYNKGGHTIGSNNSLSQSQASQASSRESSSGNLAGAKKSSARKSDRGSREFVAGLGDVEGGGGLAQAAAAIGGVDATPPRTALVSADTLLDDSPREMPVIEARRRDSCFFCLARPDVCLVPACSVWCEGGGRSIATCTPYTDLAAQRNDLLRRVNELERRLEGRGGSDEGAEEE